MLTTEQFLQAELCNVERALNESLRFDYGGHASAAAFYTECMSRHKALKDTLDKGRSRRKPPDLRPLADSVSNLSEIIARIERSRLGEYSRAFADCLSATATAACTGKCQPTPTSPLFFFSSEGGLNSYAIYPGQEKIALVRRRIFNVIFPRSLKYHVLVHPILGHEIGHALMHIPFREAQIWSGLSVLFKDSPFENVATFKNWLSQYFPDTQANLIEENVLRKILRDWHEEFFCDLFGLISMGPAFLAALKSLFSAIDLAGDECGDSHPPTLVRYAMLTAAVKELGWHKPLKGAGADATSRIGDFWEELLKPGPRRPWLPSLDLKKVQAATRQLFNNFSKCEQVVYTPVPARLLEELLDQLKNHVPPIGHQQFKPKNFSLRSVDYRTILYAGWLTLVDPPIKTFTLKDDRFYDVNRLCDQAILQQEAVVMQAKKARQ